MRIKRIEISAFGKFKDFSIDFTDGFNLIYGKNEDGKTTVMAFIALMLYGNAGTSGRTDISKNIRKKYMPWSGEQMAGDMEIEVNGRAYRIHKEFKATAKSDKVSITDTETGEKLNLHPGTEIGKHFLGLDYQGFEKSIFGFGSESFAGEENADISLKLSNISESGDESISPKTAVLRLEKAKEDLISKRGNKGRLVEVIDKVKAINEQIDAFNAKEEIKKSLRAEYEKIEEELEGLAQDAKAAREYATLLERQQKAKQLRHLAELITERDITLEKLKEASKVSHEDLAEFAALSAKARQEEENLKIAQNHEAERTKKRKTGFGIALAFGIIFVLIGVIGGFLNPKLFVSTAMGATILVIAALSGKKGIGISEAREESLNALLTETAEFLKDKNCQTADELEAAYRRGITLEEELKILDKNIASLKEAYEISEEDRERLLNLAQDIEKALPALTERVDSEEIERQIRLRNDRLLQIKGQLGEDTADISSLEREANLLMSKKAEMEEHYRALSIAAEVMNEAAEEMSRSFTPKLKDRASEIMAKLTRGKYTAMGVSKTYEVELKDGDVGAFRQWRHLSRGTCAQSYLALRLALCEMLEEGGEKIPVILDDVFSDYDEERERQGAEFLEEYASGGRQVLFFTCHNWQGKTEKQTLG